MAPVGMRSARLRRTPIGPRSLTLALFLVTSSFAALTATDVAGQSRGLIDGRVTADEAGSPLSGVAVEVVELERRTTSDESGRFRFTGIEPGRYTLRFQLIGRTLLERTVDVSAGGVARPDIGLDAAPVALDPVLVLMSRTRLSEGVGRDRIPGSVHVIGTRALTERPVVFDDVHALLREVPGVNVTEEEGYGLRPNIGFRGTGVDRSSKISLFEDGVLAAPAPYAAPAAYYFPVVGRMSAIEVRKGSSQIRYGPNTIGGALNLVSTPIPPDFSLLVDAAGGSEESQRLRGHIGDASANFGWLIEGYRSRTDGFKELDGGGPTGFDVQDYVAKVRVNTDLDADLYQELELKAGWYDERSDETYLGLTEADFAVNPNRRYAGSQEDVMNADHQQVQLRHFVRFPSGLDVTTTLYRNTFARAWYKLGSVMGTSIAGVLSDPTTHATALSVLQGSDATDALSVRNNNREYLSQGVQSAVGFGFGDRMRHELEVGVRVHHDEEDRFQNDDTYSMQSGRMFLSASGAPGSQDNRVGAATALALHVQDRIQLGRVTLTPGVRYEAIDLARTDYAAGDEQRDTPTGLRESSVSVLIPGLGVGFDLSRRTQLFAGVHKGFGSPGPGSDEATVPESSVSYELGARLGGAGASMELTGFFSDYDNILGASTLSTGGDGEGDLFNGGAVRALGLEVGAKADPVLARGSAWSVPLQVSYTLTRATFGSEFESDYGPWGTVEVGDRLPYLPTHQLFASAGLQRGAWSGRVNVAASSRMRTTAGQGEPPASERTDAFGVLGVGVDWEIHQGGTVYLAVENLTDARHVVSRRPAGLRPGLPRTLQAGVRIHR
jgi:Fe(3+) dicitrate transport protein